MSVKTELTKTDVCENLLIPKQDLDENLKEENSNQNYPDCCMIKETKSSTETF